MTNSVGQSGFAVRLGKGSSAARMAEKIVSLSELIV
jgi:hypothetical protein